jgi:hypothetical protein
LASIATVADLDATPLEARTFNIKPSRVGRLETLGAGATGRLSLHGRRVARGAGDLDLRRMAEELPRSALQAIAEWVRKPKTLELIRRAIDDAEASGELSVSQAAEKRAEVEEIEAHSV